MIAGSLSEAAGVMNAVLIGDDGSYRGVGTDSRRVREAELFFALRGPNFDGHDYVAAALQAGASAAVVERREVGSAGPLLLTGDPRSALGRLGAHWRGRCAAQVVAITGSNGKTTVKEMLARVLRAAAPTLATRGNLNNDIGLPLTLAELDAGHRYAVLEMGANHPGEIAYLTALARPDVALITNAGPAHLEGFGSVAGVARAKGEIYAGLGPSGIAIVNADDEHVSLWRELAAGHTLISFGTGVADVSAALVDGVLSLRHGGEQAECRCALAGEHNARNAAAAAAAALALGIALERIAAALDGIGSVAGRLQLRDGLRGARVIDDSYNANPASLAAALEVLASQSRPRRYLLLGDMAELGADAAAMHARAGEQARSCGVRGLYCVGPLAAHAARAFGSGAYCYDDAAEAAAALVEVLDEDVCVLVKGSRAAGLERAVALLVATGETGG